MINHISKLQDSSAQIQNKCIGTNKMITVKKYIRSFRVPLWAALEQFALQPCALPKTL